MFQVIDTQKEEPKLHNAMQEWAEEDVIFYLNYANQYSAFSYTEFLEQVSMWKDDEQITDLELTEDNIQDWTYNNQDYYRLTFTSEKMPRVSRTELIFNRLVMGLTYIVKKADYEKHQDELFSKLGGEPKETRVLTSDRYIAALNQLLDEFDEEAAAAEEEPTQEEVPNVWIKKIKSRNPKKCGFVAGDAL